MTPGIWVAAFSVYFELDWLATAEFDLGMKVSLWFVLAANLCLPAIFRGLGTNFLDVSSRLDLP